MILAVKYFRLRSALNAVAMLRARINACGKWISIGCERRRKFVGFSVSLAAAIYILGFAGEASSACPTPNQLTNGQVADAGPVMANFNAISSCAIAAAGSPSPGNLATFSSPTTVTNGDLSGDVTTSGTLATTLAASGVSAGTYGDATHTPQITIDAKGRITAASSVAVAGGGGSPGTPPTIVQSGVANGTSGCSLTLGTPPTSGNLLVAFASAGGTGAGTGWTSVASSSGGVAYGLIATKVAGVGESATQTPCTATGAAGVVVWELNGQAANPVLFAATGVGSGTFASTAQAPGLVNVIALGAIIGDGAATTFGALLNMTQDQISNGGTRSVIAGHSTGSTPVAQALTNLSSASTRNYLILVTR